MARPGEDIQDTLLVILRLAEVLEPMNIPYIVGGSVASSTLGSYRSTQDVDILAQMQPADIAPLVAALEGDFYADADMMYAALQHRSSFNVIHLPTMVKADIFTDADTPFAQQQLQRRLRLPLFGTETHPIYVCSGEDIVLQKLLWYRMTGERSDRQWSDVQGVLRVQAPTIDISYMRHWAGEIGVADLLRTALEDAGLP